MRYGARSTGAGGAEEGGGWGGEYKLTIKWRTDSHRLCQNIQQQRTMSDTDIKHKRLRTLWKLLIDYTAPACMFWTADSLAGLEGELGLFS